MTIVTLTLNPALDLTTSVDVVEPVHKLRCTAPRLDPGGGGINVARMVHALGGMALAVFPAGGGAGARLETLLAATGVPIHAVPIAGDTRESFTVDEASSGRQFRFVLPGPELSRKEIDALLAGIEAAAPRIDYLVASGSLPPGVDAGIYAELGALARRIGARLVVDSAPAALARIAGAGAWLIKPSYSELEALAGHPVTRDDDQLRAARRLREQGFAEVVIVSLAERGALLVVEGIEARLPAARVEAVSGVGAGDSMIAGMLVLLGRGEPLIEAVRFGMAAGAAALGARGTQLATRDAVDRIYAAMPRD